MRTRKQLFDAAKKHRVRCDLCKRWLRNTRTRFHAKMARALWAFYDKARVGWYVFPSATRSSFYRTLLSWNFTKLPCWGLVESEKIDPTHNRKRWRLTKLGLRFVRGEVRIPQYVRIPTGTMNTAYGKPFGKKIALADALPDGVWAPPLRRSR